MSFIKYRLKEVATDFGVTPKEIAEIISKFYEKPKSNTQVLTEDELNVVFDYMTYHNQIRSLEQVFAVAKPKEEPVKEAPKAPAAPQQQTKAQAPQQQSRPQVQKPAQTPAAPQKNAEPERKRERRVVDTSAVQVNAARFDDRVDSLVSERVQNYAGGKQRIGGGKNKQQQKQQNNKFKGNKAKNEEQEKLRRLQMEVARKAPVTVKIPDEITVGELASRM